MSVVFPWRKQTKIWMFRECPAQMGPEGKADPPHVFPGQGVMKPEMAERARLRKENAKLKMERDLLKKQRPTTPEESM